MTRKKGWFDLPAIFGVIAITLVSASVPASQKECGVKDLDSSTDATKTREENLQELNQRFFDSLNSTKFCGSDIDLDSIKSVPKNLSKNIQRKNKSQKIIRKPAIKKPESGVSLLDSCLGEVESHRTICTLSYGTNWTAARNCKVWAEFNKQRCLAIYNTSKLISTDLGSCLYEAKGSRGNCRLIHNNSPYEKQKCNERSFDQEEFCFKIH